MSFDSSRLKRYHRHRLLANIWKMFDRTLPLKVSYSDSALDEPSLLHRLATLAPFDAMLHLIDGVATVYSPCDISLHSCCAHTIDTRFEESSMTSINGCFFAVLSKGINCSSGLSKERLAVHFYRYSNGRRAGTSLYNAIVNWPTVFVVYMSMSLNWSFR